MIRWFQNRRWWQKILLLLLVVLALEAVYVFWPQGVWPFRTDLSHLADVGETYDVEILRDTYGVPHIFGQTDADAAYGLGYAHAEDDFLTIQQAFVAARGNLAMVYGIDAAPNDYLVQLLRIWDTVDAQYETIPADVRAVMQGYADGLNHYAALHPDEVILPALFPVRGEDIAAGFMHRVPLFFGLDGALTELFAETRQRPVSAAEEQRSGGAEGNLLCPSAPLSLCRTALPVTTKYGSNVLAVGPGRSANGETLLAINSHQPWEGIVAWYEAHVHSEAGWDMVGGLLPGSPTITHGHNRHLGWAFTVNSPDLVDVYVLDVNPDNPDQYWFDGEWRELEVRQVPITVQLFGRFRWTVQREALWSVYGPTVRVDHGTYAVRYAGMGEIGHVEQFLRLNKATNLEEWLAAMRDGPLPMFNAGYADADGNVFYVYNGLLPQRAAGYDWEQYLPGNTSETLWTEYVPFDGLPQVLNPPSGFIQNANSEPWVTTLGAGNPDPAAFANTLGIDDGLSNRALRALELLGSDEAISPEAFYAYKYDMYYALESDVAALVRTLTNAPLPDDGDVQTAVSLLADWDLQTNPESVGASIALLSLYFAEQQDGADVDFSKLVGGDVPAGAALAGLEQAVDLLVENFGRVDVPWVEVNRLVRGDVDLGLGGGPDVLHAVYGELTEDGRFHGVAGDSYVLLVTWDADGTVRSQSIHQYGSATLRAESPHYADQAPIFVQRELKPVWMDEDVIRANLAEAYRPGGR